MLSYSALRKIPMLAQFLQTNILIILMFQLNPWHPVCSLIQYISDSKPDVDLP
jgi:hypothetical protein